MMPEALGAAAGAGAGASSSLLDLLAPLDYPRQSLWNAVYSPFAAAGNGDYTQLMRALPGLIGGGAGAMLGGFPGAVLGAGAAQGLARLSGSSLFDAPTGGDVVRGLGGDSDSIPGMIGGMGLQMAGDPLTFLGASMGARAAGPNKLPGGPIMGPKLPGGAPEMPASIPTQFDAITPGPRQWPTMGYDAQLNPIPATSFGAHTYGPPTMSDAAFLRAQAGKEGAESLMGSTQFAPPPPSVQPSMAQLDEMVNSLKGDPMARFDPTDIRPTEIPNTAGQLPLEFEGGLPVNLDELVQSGQYNPAMLLQMAQSGRASRNAVTADSLQQALASEFAAIPPSRQAAIRSLEDDFAILADAYETGDPALDAMRMNLMERLNPRWQGIQQPRTGIVFGEQPRSATVEELLGPLEHPNNLEGPLDGSWIQPEAMDIPFLASPRAHLGGSMFMDDTKNLIKYLESVDNLPVNPLPGIDPTAASAALADIRSTLNNLGYHPGHYARQMGGVRLSPVADTDIRQIVSQANQAVPYGSTNPERYSEILRALAANYGV